MPSLSGTQSPSNPAASPISLESCREIGAYDRVYVRQRDDRTGICSFIALVFLGEDSASFDLTSLSLPDNWSVETMEAAVCPLPPRGGTSYVTLYTRAVGSIGFSSGQGGLPSRMKVDVVLSRPLESSETHPDTRIADQRIVAEDLELTGSCQGSY